MPASGRINCWFSNFFSYFLTFFFSLRIFSLVSMNEICQFRLCPQLSPKTIIIITSEPRKTSRHMLARLSLSLTHHLCALASCCISIISSLLITIILLTLKRENIPRSSQQQQPNIRPLYSLVFIFIFFSFCYCCCPCVNIRVVVETSYRCCVLFRASPT